MVREVKMIELNKNYVTRDGREVVIYTIDAGGNYPVHAGVVDNETKEIKMQVYNLHGETPNGLPNDPLKIMLDVEDELPAKGDVVLVADFGDLLPMLGVFQYSNEDGIWALVDTGDKKLSLEVFDVMYSEVSDLNEALVAFIEDRNGELSECEDEPEPEEEKPDVKEFGGLTELFDYIDATLYRMERSKKRGA